MGYGVAIEGHSVDAFTLEGSVGSSITAAGDRLCFDDLAIAHGFADAAASRYRITRYDRDAGELAAAEAAAAPGGRACAPLGLPHDGDGYTIVRVETRRPGFSGATFVHVARTPGTGAPRVIGIWRA